MRHFRLSPILCTNSSQNPLWIKYPWSCPLQCLRLIPFLWCCTGFLHFWLWFHCFISFSAPNSYRIIPNNSAWGWSKWSPSEIEIIKSHWFSPSTRNGKTTVSTLSRYRITSILPIAKKGSSKIAINCLTQFWQRKTLDFPSKCMYVCKSGPTARTENGHNAWKQVKTQGHRDI